MDSVFALIQRIDGMNYLGSDCTWTEELHNACKFADCAAASRWWRDNLRDTDVYVVIVRNGIMIRSRLTSKPRISLPVEQAGATLGSAVTNG